MKMNIDGTIGKAIADYTGRRVTDLEVVPDPFVPGTYAIRAQIKTLCEVGTVDFLIAGVPVQKVTADDLSECEFTEWPPTVSAAYR